MDTWTQQFSIKDLENFTGIKAHTLRAWEQRYGLLKPQRTPTNIRYYTDQDLKFLLNVAVLLRLGYKISKIAEMSQQQIAEIIRSSENIDVQDQHFLNLLKVSMMSYDEVLFNHVTNQFVASNSEEACILKLYLPFLQNVGWLWMTNAICPAQEHFVSNLIRQKMYVWIDRIEESTPNDNDVYILYLPELEIHEISLLMIHFFAKQRGYKSIYLGQSVPFDDLTQIATKFNRVQFVSYCTTKPAKNEAVDYLKRIAASFADSNHLFHFTGPIFKSIQSPSDQVVRVYDNAESLLEQVFAASEVLNVSSRN